MLLITGLLALPNHCRQKYRIIIFLLPYRSNIIITTTTTHQQHQHNYDHYIHHHQIDHLQMEMMRYQEFAASCWRDIHYKWCILCLNCSSGDNEVTRQLWVCPVKSSINNGWLSLSPSLAVCWRIGTVSDLPSITGAGAKFSHQLFAWFSELMKDWLDMNYNQTSSNITVIFCSCHRS